jgi:polyhydroxybutyrate depolymerase
MKFNLYLAFAALSLIFTITCIAQDRNEKILVDDFEREYIIHLPKEHDVTIPLPLVLVFHGGGGDAEGMARLTKFSKLADKENFIVVYPSGFNKNWGDGRIGKKLPMDRDDVKFISYLLDTLKAKYNFDTTSVFATGISNGGFFSIYLAYKMPARIKAIAPVTANIPESYEEDFKTEPPISIMLINGTDDPLVKYDGGFVGFSEESERGKSISTDETIKKWAKNNECSTNRKIEEMEDKNGRDDCKATKYTYYRCKNRTRVVLIKIQGGGHTWPGGVQYLPKAIIGNVCKDFDATLEIWNFFKRFLPSNEGLFEE